MDNPITFNQVFDYLLNHTFEILVSLSIFIEIVPIKFNPISWFVKKLYAPIRKDIADMEMKLRQDMDTVKKDLLAEIDEIRKKQEEESKKLIEIIANDDLRDISKIRWEIIEFANSIRNEQVHRRDEYRTIFADYSTYHDLIFKLKLDNGLIDEEYEFIKDHYDKNKDSEYEYF